VFILAYPGAGPPSPRLNTCLGFRRYWNLWRSLKSKQNNVNQPPCPCPYRVVFVPLSVPLFVPVSLKCPCSCPCPCPSPCRTHVRLPVPVPVHVGPVSLSLSMLDPCPCLCPCPCQDPSRFFQSVFLSMPWFASKIPYLDPCRPPLLGLINTTNGWVPGKGVI